MATTSVAVLSAGLMGTGMARSLARAGHEVTARNRTSEKASPLAGENGIKVVENLHEALGHSDVIVTTLFDANAVTEVRRTVPPTARKQRMEAWTFPPRCRNALSHGEVTECRVRRLRPRFPALRLEGHQPVVADLQGGSATFADNTTPPHRRQKPSERVPDISC
jgi:hypothetical protein